MSADEHSYGQFREVDKRRVDPSERRAYNIKNMWQRHHEIVNLASQGFKQVEIAEILNIHPQTVSNTLNSQLGAEKLDVIRQDRDNEARIRAEKVKALTNKALEVYHEIFDDESGECTLKDKMKVADTVLLELSGMRVPTRIQSSSTHTILSHEELEAFKQRGIAAAKESGLVIDVTPERKQIDQNSNGLDDGTSEDKAP